MRRLVLFCIFVNLLNVWLNIRQLDSRICFCVQPVVFYQLCNFWKMTLHTHESEKSKALYNYESRCDLAESLNNTFETVATKPSKRKVEELRMQLSVCLAWARHGVGEESRFPRWKCKFIPLKALLFYKCKGIVIMHINPRIK